MTVKARVTDVLDDTVIGKTPEDTQVLFSGVIEGGARDGQRVSFHVSRPGADAIVHALHNDPDGVYVELPE